MRNVASNSSYPTYCPCRHNRVPELMIIESFKAQFGIGEERLASRMENFARFAKEAARVPRLFTDASSLIWLAGKMTYAMSFRFRLDG
jgi:hypothetical protein